MFKWILILLTTLIPTLTPAFEYSGRPHIVSALKSLEATSRELAKEYEFCVLNVGDGDLTGSRKSVWGVSFTSNKQMTLEEVRPLVKSMIVKFLDKLYKDPIFKERWNTKDRPSSSSFGPGSVSFKLAFWDENVNRPLYPYIAQARFSNGEVYFHYADPKTQALLPPTIESLEFLGINTP